MHVSLFEYLKCRYTPVPYAIPMLSHEQILKFFLAFKLTINRNRNSPLSFCIWSHVVVSKDRKEYFLIQPGHDTFSPMEEGCQIIEALRKWSRHLSPCGSVVKAKILKKLRYIIKNYLGSGQHLQYAKNPKSRFAYADGHFYTNMDNVMFEYPIFLFKQWFSAC